MERNGTSPSRNGLLDALRGVAVAAVVAYHVWPDRVTGGFLGVDVFFVLSGFLITDALVSQLASGRAHVLRQFWARRVRRLAPALLVVLVTVTALAGIVGGSPAARLRPQVVGALTFTSNWYQAGSGQSYFDRFDPPVFQHLWSLAVEEQLYLVWPLLLLALVRFVPAHRCRVIVVAALVAASASAMAVLEVPGHDPSRLYFGTDTHGFSALVGALAALSTGLLPRALEGRHRLRIAGGVLMAMLAALGILMGSFALMDDTGALAYRGGILAADLCTAVLVLGSVELDHVRLSRSAPARVLRWLGTRSYGVYLWHWPVLVLADGRWPAGSPAEVAARDGLVVGASLLLCALSWRYVEEPVLRGTWRHQLRSSVLVTRGLKRRVVPAVAGAALACVLSVYAVSTSP
ncbi:MAG TPA: acyltransferase [Nocardioides sp.]|nr:acyltransferase [Nocardioides sp.]